MLDRLIKNELFGFHSRRRHMGKAGGRPDEDGFTRIFGSTIPASVPESSAWWNMHAKDLFAITEDFGETTIWERWAENSVN